MRWLREERIRRLELVTLRTREALHQWSKVARLPVLLEGLRCPKLV